MNAINVSNEHTTNNTHIRRKTYIQDQLNYCSHFKVISNNCRQHIDFKNWMIYIYKIDTNSLLALLGTLSL